MKKNLVMQNHSESSAHTHYPGFAALHISYLIWEITGYVKFGGQSGLWMEGARINEIGGRRTNNHES